MDVSYRWLKDLAPGITGSPREIADRLALLGAPVDEIVELGAGIRDVVVARVDAVRQHPNADRLRLCTVVAGTSDALQVVCGAPNVEAGRYYPFAPVGATLPGGVEIRKAKLRGETSEGMLCSARELGLGKDHGGLMTLAGEWAPGTSFVEALGLDDARLVVDVTPNRGDLLSHFGVARELAPGGETGIELRPFQPRAPALVVKTVHREEGEVDGCRVALDDADGCPRYLGAVVRGVRVGPSPEWLASRLRAVSVRPINNVVDATNYVLQELGQPLHAFDLDRLEGRRVHVRGAHPGETLRTLDGVDRTLEPGDLVIADGTRGVALAGVMGGENSEVTAETKDLFIECAVFDPQRVRKTARRLGLSTDASYRFERGVDPERQVTALKRVVDLILATAGGAAAGGVDVDPEPFERPVVPVRTERVERLLGVAVTAKEIRTLLEPIGFEVNRRASPVRVSVPGSRPDVTREADVIEEIARRRGYGSFPEALLPFRPTAVPEAEYFEVERRLRGTFLRWGFHESRTVSFAPPAEGSVPVLNPLSAEEAHLRTALVPGLLRRVEHNLARGVRDVRLFSVGTVFRAGAAGGAAGEEVHVAAAFCGASRPPHWSGPAPDYDAWDLRGLLDDLAPHWGDARVEPGDAPNVAPFTAEGMRLALSVEGEAIGGGGEAAAGALDAPAWAPPVWVLEARIPAAPVDRRAFARRPVPEFPGSDRDLALLVPQGVTAAQLDAAVREAAGALLVDLYPFDLYEGKGIPEGTRSLAWRLRFRAADRTLTDAEVDAVVERVLARLEEAHGVRRR